MKLNLSIFEPSALENLDGNGTVLDSTGEKVRRDEQDCEAVYSRTSRSFGGLAQENATVNAAALFKMCPRERIKKTNGMWAQTYTAVPMDVWHRQQEEAERLRQQEEAKRLRQQEDANRLRQQEEAKWLLDWEEAEWLRQQQAAQWLVKQPPRE